MLDGDGAQGAALGLLKPVPFLNLGSDYKDVCGVVRLQEAGGGGEGDRRAKQKKKGNFLLLQKSTHDNFMQFLK